MQAEAIFPCRNEVTETNLFDAFDNNILKENPKKEEVINSSNLISWLVWRDGNKSNCVQIKEQVYPD